MTRPSNHLYMTRNDVSSTNIYSNVSIYTNTNVVSMLIVKLNYALFILLRQPISATCTLPETDLFERGFCC
jgi:hypothetical protein